MCGSVAHAAGAKCAEAIKGIRFMPTLAAHRHGPRPRIVVVSCLFAFFVAISAQAGELAFLDIGYLPGASPDTTGVVAVSGDGHAFIGSSGGRGFRWRGGVMTEIGAGAAPAAVNQDGSVVVGQTTANKHAFLWDEVSGLHDLGELASFSGPTFGAGVSADGLTVAGYTQRDDYSTRAWIWTASGGMQDIGELAPGNSAASGISGDGTIVVGYSAGHAFRWTAETGMVDITPDLGTDNAVSGAAGISTDGSTIIGSYNLTPGAPHVWGRQFGWTAETGLFDLPWPPWGDTATPGSAFATSADGSRIVGEIIDWFFYASLWTAQIGTVDLNAYLASRGLDTSDWDLLQTVSISGDGDVIVGGGYHGGLGGATYQSWIVTGLNSTETIFASTFDPHI